VDGDRLFDDVAPYLRASQSEQLHAPALTDGSDWAVCPVCGMTNPTFLHDGPVVTRWSGREESLPEMAECDPAQKGGVSKIAQSSRPQARDAART
jgi:hypothetical protein